MCVNPQPAKPFAIYLTCLGSGGIIVCSAEVASSMCDNNERQVCCRENNYYHGGRHVYLQASLASRSPRSSGTLLSPGLPSPVPPSLSLDDCCLMSPKQTSTTTDYNNNGCGDEVDDRDDEACVDA